MASSATIHRESMSADSTAATALPADLSGLEGVIHSLLLRALVKIVDRMNGAALRSDDKSRRPLAIAEVDLSIESPVRSPAEPRETMLRVGSLELDLINRTAKRGDRPIDLLPSEFRLLKIHDAAEWQIADARKTLPRRMARIAASGSPPKMRTGCSMSSSPPNPAAWAWDFPSAVRSWRLTGGDYGPPPTYPTVPRSNSRCR